MYCSGITHLARPHPFYLLIYYLFGQAITHTLRPRQNKKTNTKKLSISTTSRLVFVLQSYDIVPWRTPYAGIFTFYLFRRHPPNNPKPKN